MDLLSLLLILLFLVFTIISSFYTLLSALYYISKNFSPLESAENNISFPPSSFWSSLIQVSSSIKDNKLSLSLYTLVYTELIKFLLFLVGIKISLVISPFWNELPLYRLYVVLFNHPWICICVLPIYFGCYIVY